MMSAALALGFARPVHDAQAVFRSLLDALSRPGLRRTLTAGLCPPAPLTPELAAVTLALADPDAPLWLDAPLAASAEIARYLRFHTGARIVTDPADAAFALICDPAGPIPVSDFPVGTDEDPDRSTTLVIALDSLSAGSPLTFVGPGIRDRIVISASPLPGGLKDRFRRNVDLFPRGLDVVLVAPGEVLGIPRSARLIEAV